MSRNTPGYGSDKWSLPKFLKTALSGSDGAMQVLSEEESRSAAAASLSKFPVIGSVIDWERVDGAELRVANDERQEAAFLAEVLRGWVGEHVDVILLWTNYMPDIRIAAPLLIANLAEVIEAPLWFWIYSPSDRVLIEVDRAQGIFAARIPGS